MARRRNPRTLLLEALRGTKRTLVQTINYWDTYGQTTDDVVLPDGRKSHTWRKRRSEEYPERQERYYIWTFAALDTMINELQEAKYRLAADYATYVAEGKIK